MILGIIADDFTGATDVASMLVRAGLRTVQTIGVPDDGLSLPDVDAVVVSLKSRSIEASKAVARSREADKAKEPPKPVPPGSYQNAAIILLTDGQTTTGPDPIESARMAADQRARKALSE